MSVHIRERLEDEEYLFLAPQAAKAKESKGRMVDEEKCPMRTDFQRDHDRILHSKSFRRLADKTHVYAEKRTDHDRTRLTHSLEVAQVGRTIARALKLNSDLVEAISLGHDIGHSPWGHSGEKALDSVYREYDEDAHFHHALQSYRIATELEKNGKGLNLTFEVLDGIKNHSKGSQDWAAGVTKNITLEGQIVALADRIAYSSHDIDDAIRKGLLNINDFPPNVIKLLGDKHSSRLSNMIFDVIYESQNLDVITMSKEMTEVTNELKNFMYDHLYLTQSIAPQMRAYINDVIQYLFHYYMANPHEVSLEAAEADLKYRARLVADLIAGMTDSFAENKYEEIKDRLCKM